MALTERRRQFLEAIHQLYDQTGTPVHYTDLACKLQVSKWTAYDMVKILAGKGLVQLQYLNDREAGQVGRSRLGAVPIEPEVPTKRDGILSEEVHRTKKSLLHLFHEMDDSHICLESLVHDARTAVSKELSFIYLIAIIFLLIKMLSPVGVQSWLRTASIETGLLSALGFVIGLAVRSTLPTDVRTYLYTQIAEAQSFPDEISKAERARIFDFWQETLNAI
ncbi:MAG: hypothetical protein PHV61_00270 [Limnochordia bacterium]|jgi:energy-coupling factor transport system substrate-specific component|nr:hypothetical protein [Limnochordia bacterium]MDD2628595.1 hypothetical protein [Limnochordia bacterium]MDD4517347.1 hypothetical protein [Limnochordia bacterium]